MPVTANNTFLSIAKVLLDGLKRERQNWLAYEMILPDDLLGEYGGET